MHTSRLSPAAARRRPTAGLCYLTVAGILWGTGGLTGSLLYRTVDLAPMAVATYRLGIGGAVILAFLAVVGRRWPRHRAAWTRIVVVGLLSALYQASYFGAVALTSVSLATLITIGTAPVLVLAVQAVTGRSRLDRRAVTASCLALAGLGLLVGLPADGFAPVAVLSSAGLALASAAGFATLTLVGVRPVAGLDELATTGLGFTVGGLLLAPFAAAGAGLGFTPGLPALALLVALGTGPTALAYLLYFRGLRTVEAGTAALMALLEPLVGALLAALLLGDRLGPVGLAGAALLGAAVVLAARVPAAAGVPAAVGVPAEPAGNPAVVPAGPGDASRRRPG
ncbi:DMT family transporter [Plantactinospora sp. CA-290183]|uniref:DMT family transporter n=1 Tax=Plantactinospora sp. CA-290183 TaxID=3240006 RepID=UPI003D947492